MKIDLQQIAERASEVMNRPCFARRWNKHGHDHIYISYTTAAGNVKSVGYIDLDRGTVVPAKKGRQREALLRAMEVIA